MHRRRLRARGQKGTGGIPCLAIWEFSSGACPAYEPMLEDYLNGDLAGAEAQRAAAHVESCAACAEAWNSAVMGTALLRAAAGAGDPGPAFSRVVTARIRAAEEERSAERGSFWQPFVSFGVEVRRNRHAGARTVGNLRRRLGQAAATKCRCSTSYRARPFLSGPGEHAEKWR